MSHQRDSFVTKFGIVAAVAGSAIGLGNIWKYPYMVGANGGSAFILVYILAVIFFGYPLACSELALGRKLRMNTVDAFHALGKNKFWKFVGFLPLITMLLITSYYVMITGWVAWYFLISIGGQIREVPATTLPADFYKKLFSQMTASIPIVLTTSTVLLILVALVNARGIKKGIETCSKIMMPILFVLIIILIGYSVTLPGFGKACAYMCKPDFTAIKPSVIVAAIGQTFLSLSLAMGILTTYGSYIDKSQDIRSISKQMVIMDTTIAILAGFAIFPAVFTYGLEPGMGPGLIFMSLPQVFLKMAGGALFAPAFFALVLLAAFTSLISLFELLATYLIEKFRISRYMACAWGVAILFFGLLLCTISQRPDSNILVFGSKTVLDIFDYFTNNITLPITGMLICILVGFRWKTENLEKELAIGAKKTASLIEQRTFDILIKWIAPPIIFVLMVVWIYSAS